MVHGSENVELLSPRPTPKMEDHPLLAVRHWLCNIFAATLRTGSRSSIRNLRKLLSLIDRELIFMVTIHFLSTDTKRL